MGDVAPGEKEKKIYIYI